MATVLLGGASGFIGTALAAALRADGHQVVPLTRHSAATGVPWAPEAGRVDADRLARIEPDVVVNLAGTPIARRWTDAHRRHIRESRVTATRALAQAVAALPRKPATFIGGSAIGYYGARHGDEWLDEDAPPGTDFLARTTRDWEDATAPASDGGVRVVQVRTGIALGEQGGVLQRMLLPFRLGAGGRMGSGRQWMSWIALDDVVRAIRFLIDAPSVAGPVNAVAPEPVRNAEFTAALARALGRPALLTVPAAALRLVFGAMADHTILASQRVLPKRLAQAEFSFVYPRLEQALSAIFRRSGGATDR